MSNTELFQNRKLIFAFVDGCYWCELLKRDTLPMVKSLKIKYQIIRESQHLAAYDTETYGYPFICVADDKGFPIKSHGGFLNISELIELINTTLEKE